MYDNPFKGGRNHKAPYETTHIRMPIEIIPLIKEIVSRYKRLCYSGATGLREKYVDSLKQFVGTSLDTAGFSKPPEGYIPKEDYQKILVLLRIESANNKTLQTTVDSLTERIEKANEILNHACTLKSNAGGAIKHAIREAQEHLE